ncbi:TPA: tyrosine--tRNA ligase [Candidatus Micrarchaeota archaeon]|nr:MAG: tyrosine--tRNA ligase [Candidatus Micrarchaeota archaeon CG1_02_51_15]HII38814.1 tyrosine--tRNA ligase [Candidatus Micrarchaeota archaeon]
MDSETCFDLIKGIAQEVVTEAELRELLETNAHPLAYDGFEPSGLAHLPVGVYRPLLVKQLLNAGVRLNLLLADSFAWINNKVGGDLERVRVVGKYFLEVWKATGVDLSKVNVVWHKEHFDDGEYWKKVLLVAKNHTLARTTKCMQIAGRKEGDIKQVAQLFYPSMQAADVFHMEVDICQLGMDQRKANMLARDLAPSLGFKKPVAVHHKMLLSLSGIGSASQSDELSVDAEIDAKMSKSKPDTCIFVHDSVAEITRKINKAFCPPRQVNGNPILEYAKEIVFRAKPVLHVERPVKYGGSVDYCSYAELEKEFVSGSLTPPDLKNAVAIELDALIAPVRMHFEKNKEAAALYAQVKGFETTR